MQQPQSVRTPEHSAVAKLRRELTDERKKLQVLSDYPKTHGLV